MTGFIRRLIKPRAKAATNRVSNPLSRTIPVTNIETSQIEATLIKIDLMIFLINRILSNLLWTVNFFSSNSKIKIED